MKRDPASQDYPDRKVIRSWFDAQRVTKTLWPLGIVIFDLLAFLACLAFIIASNLLILKAIVGMVAGVFILRLFILGHDACHGSLTSSRRLNKLIGKIAFLPALMPFTHWEISHNTQHHVYTNLKGQDVSWIPFSKQEFDQLPRSRQWLERLYRSPFGAGPYYLIDMWWQHAYAPPTSNRRATADKNLITLVMACWLGGLVLSAPLLNTAVLENLLCGFVIPFVVWGYAMGFIIYLHHTHPTIRWYEDQEEWRKSAVYLSATVHIEFPSGVGSLIHHINDHPAHHTDMRIPNYGLTQAQNTIEQHLPGKIQVEKFSWSYYRHVTRQCKLYDFKNKQWMNFDGTATS